MGEDIFFDALFRVMWDLETDIFEEPDRTLALLADIAPKCKKQRSRLRAMYECGAMDYIEKAVANRKKYEKYMSEAVSAIVGSMNLSIEKAVFSVNVIINLWNGELPEIDEYIDDEPYEDDEEAIFDEESTIDENDDLDVDVIFPEDDEKKSADNEKNKGGGEEMLFLQDTVTDTETTEEENTTPEQEPAEGDNGTSEPAQPKEPILNKLVNSWCRCSFEDGRPFMFACPIGWFMILLCSALGCFMVYDIPLGDKLVTPTFVFMFTVLTAKRHYRFESVGRFSILIAVLYLAAMFRSLWVGGAEFRYICIIVDIAALAVFNSGRIGDFLDGSKKRPGLAYTLIILFSCIITAGAYAVQHVPV